MAPGHRPQQVNARRKAFLQAFKVNGNVSEAARVAGIRRETVYRWLDSNAEFKAAFDEAEQEAVDQVERVAHELATGVHAKPVVSAGKLVTHEPIYSERMIELILKARRPDRYKDKREVEHSGEIRSVQALLSDIPAEDS